MSNDENIKRDATGNMLVNGELSVRLYSDGATVVCCGVALQLDASQQAWLARELRQSA